MKNLTTSKAILFGLGLIALAIASVPYSSQIIKPAFAKYDIQKVALCDYNTMICAKVSIDENLGVFANSY